MKSQEFRKLVREEIAKVISEEYADRKSQALGMLTNAIKKSKYKNEKVAATRALGYIKSMSLTDEQWYDVVQMLSVFAASGSPGVSSSGWTSDRPDTSSSSGW